MTSGVVFFFPANIVLKRCVFQGTRKRSAESEEGEAAAGQAQETRGECWWRWQRGRDGAGGALAMAGGSERLDVARAAVGTRPQRVVRTQRRRQTPGEGLWRLWWWVGR